ncbi:hypothetical protein GCHA_2381 [Paraglaciecola chathamensis S18K6]|uniref:Uncharacterized protein n=1 Tax=Paraglaciecola chathamensis S18K6 TaxID=1127672 RepID=A0AAV3UZQ2_9ALTE|nr:hypothetical protein GCHA_2381 [Paraglaciecola chathamensis S18K6]
MFGALVNLCELNEFLLYEYFSMSNYCISSPDSENQVHFLLE